jgi:hypothetical protein
MVYFSKEYVKEALFRAVEGYNLMILKKKVNDNGGIRIKIAEMKGMFYNYLRREIMNSDLTFRVDDLSCDFNSSGTINKFYLSLPLKKTIYVYDYIKDILSVIGKLEKTAAQNEISLIINSINRDTYGSATTGKSK